MKKYLLLGLLGTCLSLICDLLLGWMVYPAAEGPFGLYIGMMAGCEQLSWARLGLSALFGATGIPMQYFGFKALADLVGQGGHPKSAVYRKLMGAGAISTLAMGGTVHVLCVALMALIKVECLAGFDARAAGTLLGALPPSAVQFALWGILPVSAVMMTPYYIMAVVLFLAIFKGRTCLPKWACLLNPLTAMVVCNAVGMLVPNTAFSNGLSMSNMALGGMIPFLGALLLTRKS